MGIRFKFARVFVGVFDLVFMCVILTKDQLLGSRVYLVVTFLEAIVLLSYLLRLLYLMRKLHHHEYLTHRWSLGLYGIMSVMALVLREVWGFGFSEEKKPEWQ